MSVRTPARAQLDRRRQARRPAADDQALGVDGLDARAVCQPVVTSGSTGLPVERLDAHAGRDRHHARLHRQAVGDDRALGALAVGAEDPLGRAVLVMMAEDADAVGEERRRDGLAGTASHGPPGPREFECLASRRRQDGMGMNPMIKHGYKPIRIKPCTVGATRWVARVGVSPQRATRRVAPTASPRRHDNRAPHAPALKSRPTRESRNRRL